MRDAQVIFALVGVGDVGVLERAEPCSGGYAVPLPGGCAGLCLVETEVITAGQMLTEHFYFVRRPTA